MAKNFCFLLLVKIDKVEKIKTDKSCFYLFMWKYLDEFFFQIQPKDSI